MNNYQFLFRVPLIKITTSVIYEETWVPRVIQSVQSLIYHSQYI